VLDLTILSDQTKENLKIDMIEMIDAYEITDKYVPNRHGIIFKELIYVSSRFNNII